MNWLKDVRYLVYGGGGCKGLAYVGAHHILLQWYEDHGIDFDAQLKGIAGSSIGAFMALMVCLNCSSEDLLEVCAWFDMNAVFESFNLLEFTETWGLSQREYLFKSLERLLIKHVGKPDVTFAELFDKTRKHLVIPIVRVNDAQVIYCDYKTTPERSVRNTITTSMSIPIVFAPEKVGEDIFVDGGVLDNLPWKVFPLNETLCFHLVHGLDYQISNWKSYIMQLFSIIMNQTEFRKAEFPKEHKSRIVEIETNDFYTLQPELSHHDKIRLIESGAHQMSQWLMKQSVIQILLMTLASLTGSNNAGNHDPEH